MIETLRVMTAGSVDDGKSTLIGRLLYDAKVLTRDQLAILSDDGKNNLAPDFAALTDGLIAEKEQGITIDVAYRYFTTQNRRYILADCPGHEAYTRNMVTGLSTADVAIILLDPTKLDFAKHGDDLLLTQTKRHSALLVMLGVKHIVVAVNKMDAINFDQTKYKKIESAYLAYYKKIIDSFWHGDADYPTLPLVIPLSALQGDNIIMPSTNLSWYEGKSLLPYLNQLSVASDGNDENTDGIMPVQYVLKEASGVGVKFRGYQGRVESGGFQVGDRVKIIPSGEAVGIKHIYNEQGEKTSAVLVDEVATIEFDKAVEAGRGNYILKHSEKNSAGVLESQQDIEHTMLCWFDKEPFNPHGKYILKHTTCETFVKLTDVKVKNLDDIAHPLAMPSTADKNMVVMNSIFSAKIKSQIPLLVRCYYKMGVMNRSLGSFILIDPINFHTVAAGVIF